MAAPAAAIAAPSVLGASAQIAITIPQISPVPFVLTTFTVLLLGAAYGPLRAGLTLALYLAAGAAGVPWFTEGTSGFAMPTFGYILGFLAASIAVGFLAKRGGDRTILKTVGLMVVGNVLMYAFGVPYLAFALDMSAGDAIAAGMTPFLAGDAVKLVVAALLLPGTWALVNRFRNSEG
jgi:biotin transport system substrate-specific component